MKIILTQLEIEEAIRAHVNNVITVAEGTNVMIELASPRGSQEIQATVNLVSQAEQQAAYKSQIDQVQRPTTSTTRTTSEPQASSKPAPTTEAPQAAETTADQQTSQDNAGTEEGNGQEPAPAHAKSLFGNLSRPRN